MEKLIWCNKIKWRQFLYAVISKCFDIIGTSFFKELYLSNALRRYMTQAQMFAMRHHRVGGLWLWRRDGGGGGWLVGASFSHLRSLGPVSRSERPTARPSVRPTNSLLLSLAAMSVSVSTAGSYFRAANFRTGQGREARSKRMNISPTATPPRATPRLRNLSGQTRARLLSRRGSVSLCAQSRARRDRSLVCRLHSPNSFSLACDNYFVKHEARRI